MNTCRFSADRQYRYTLRHQLGGEAGPELAVVMLNPSTADELTLDRTLQRVRSYAYGWGYAAFTVVNLFAFRATNPEDMKAAADPVGPSNDRWIKKVVSEADAVMVGWGNHGSYLDRDKAVMEMLRGSYPFCLAITNNGQPGHPLYLPGSLNRLVYRGRK